MGKEIIRSRYRAQNKSAPYYRSRLRDRKNNNISGSGGQGSGGEPSEERGKAKKNHEGYATKNRPPSTWAEICIAALTVALTFAALVAGGISYGQWDLGRKQLQFALDEAERAAKDTQNALGASQRAASAAERQAIATNDALAISDRLAGSAQEQSIASKQISEAGRQQAQTASKDLALRQIPAVDMAINFVGIDQGTMTFATQVGNSGYSIRDAELCLASDMMDGNDFGALWARVGASCRRINIIPQFGHTHQLLNPLFAIPWDSPTMEGRWIGHAVRLKFTDAAGGLHEIRRCIAYRGAQMTPQNVRFCP